LPTRGHRGKAEAVSVALHPRKRLSGQDLIARMTEISDHCAALPVLDRLDRDLLGMAVHGQRP